MRQQEKLQPALQQIWDAYYAEPAATSGFAGVAFEGDGLTLYWKGGLTGRMRTSLTTARRTGPVTVKAAAYSNAELEAAGQKIKDRIGRGVTDIQSIGYEPDGSGLHVETVPVGDLSRFAVPSAAAARASL